MEDWENGLAAATRTRMPHPGLLCAGEAVLLATAVPWAMAAVPAERSDRRAATGLARPCDRARLKR